MSTTVSEATVAVIENNSYDALSTTVGLVTIGLLLGLLVARELTRAHGAASYRPAIAAVSAVVWPLFASFFVIIALRLLNILIAF